MTFVATLIGVAQANAALAAIPAKVNAGAARGMQGVVDRGASLVRANASGRPGPNVITGAYRGSIIGVVASAGGLVRGVIGTNAVQGPRLELGFFGTDSIGRTYAQGPFPHFGPAVGPILSLATESLASSIGAALN